MKHKFSGVVGGLDMSDTRQPGRVLLLDGDSLCYQAAYKYSRLETALRAVHTEVLTKAYMTGAETCRVHITARGNRKASRGSIRAAKPYQGNRKGVPKPPLLEPLREALEARQGLPDVVFLLQHEVEADDAIIMDSYRLKGGGVVCSEDKDLRQTIYPYYDSNMDKVDTGAAPGWLGLRESERTGSRKLIGRGMEFFWGQMLCGDTADNVQGLKAYEGKACGPVRAFEILKGLGERDMAELVLRAYGRIRQNAVCEAWLLFLLRHQEDSVLQYFKELGLSGEANGLIEEWLTEDWFDTGN